MQALRPRDINAADPARRRASNGERKGILVEIDFSSVQGRQHSGTVYSSLVQSQLVIDFPNYYKADVRSLLCKSGGFYAPAFMRLYDATVRNSGVVDGVSLRRLRTKRSVSRKLPDFSASQELQDEYNWVLEWKALYDDKRANRKRRRSEVQSLPAELHPPPLGAGAQNTPDPAYRIGIEDSDNHVPNTDFHLGEVSMKLECACCFDDECTFADMIQCSEGHLFCRDCVQGLVGNAVGNRQPNIECPDQTGCKQPFPASELEKCLHSRTFGLWQRIIQEENIAAAQLEGLERCPECDFAMIFEVGIDVVPLFQCLNSDCRFVSCRRCGKKAHTGKLCESEEDAKLKKEHSVEEAMTQALVRVCPGPRGGPACAVKFLKSDGCNKMRCQKCYTVSCYLCRERIELPNPYLHFDRDHHGLGTMCKLWDADGRGDDPAARHRREVEEAERHARAEQLANQTQQVMPVPNFGHAPPPQGQGVVLAGNAARNIEILIQHPPGLQVR